MELPYLLQCARVGEEMREDQEPSSNRKCGGGRGESVVSSKLKENIRGGLNLQQAQKNLDRHITI